MMKINLDATAERTLLRMGGWYLPFAVALVQLIGSLIGPAFLISQSNAQFPPEQFVRGMGISILMTGIAILIGGLWAFLANRSARLRLDQWRDSRKFTSDAASEDRAWSEINSLTRRYVPVAGLLFLIGQSIPVAAYLYLVYQINWNQVIYILLGTAAAAIAGTALSALMLDSLLTPARQILTPASFETQLKGSGQFTLTVKLLGGFVGLILLSVLLIAPIGYRHTLLAAAGGGAPSQVSFQIQSMLAAVVVIALGLLVAWLIVRSLTLPSAQMIAAFKQIETGDLTQRVGVITADEIGELGIYFNHMIERLAVLQHSLESQVEERTAQLRATVQVGNAISAILDSDELIERVVNLIAEEFDYYYTALFLTDSTGTWAELRAATGDAGRVLRANHHRLEIGNRNMVGRAIYTREPVVAMNTADGPARFDNPLLPYTRSEIALPLVVGDRVYGALDAQSTREGEFGPEAVETLRSLANQVAVALDNAHSFQNAQQALRDMQAIQQQYLLSSWEGFTAERGTLDYAIGETDPGETLSEIEIPLTLRDQPIGGIQVSGVRDWSPEERSMIEAIAAQAALALENARLVEESQSSAHREHVVADITGKIWTSTTTDAILQTAARELGRALETDEVTIELKVEEE